jgi:hypothetical protein
MNAIKNNKLYVLATILSLALIILLLISIFLQIKHTNTLVELDKNITYFENADLEVGECVKPGLMANPCELRCRPTAEEMKMARIAWKYIENNFNEKTGLTAAAHKFPSAATWDWANANYAMFAARKFGIISQDRYEEMMGKFLTTMQKMDLFNNELPNKTYNTNTGKMVNYVNKVVKDGTGWSAADMARLLSSLNVVEQCEENLAPAIEKLTLRYRYCRALSVEGDLYGAQYTKDNELMITHEALTGYEEYLARGYELWGHNAGEARRYKFLNEVEVYGIKIPTDTRPFFSNFVESEPFWYLGFEYGIDDPESGEYIKNIYKVQEERYKRTGQITAVTEDNIDRRPYFLFNTIYTHNEPWKTINQHGEDYDEYKTVSTKAGIGMHYLFNTPYSNKVYHYLKNNHNPKRGFYAGIYEKRPGANRAMTLNTNAIILEAMLSAKMGPLQKLNKLENRGNYDGYRNRVNNFRCLPSDKEHVILEPFDGSKDSNATENCGCEEKELKAAKIAWSYFENNYNPETGYVNGLNKYKIIKPEYIGKTIMATMSAESLDIIYKDAFFKRMDKIIETLKKMKLYNKELPNLYYDAKTGLPVKKDGSKAGRAGGWDLYSIAHLMTALYHLQKDYPKYREDVFSIVAKWNFKRAVLDRKMQDRWFNGKDKGGAVELEDPAKEFYIHNALKFFNIKSYSHFYDERNLDYKAVYDHEVPMGFKHAMTNGESYLWTMIEQPYYLKYKHYSSNIYMALRDRYMTTNKFATSTEEALDRKPYWIQNAIYSHGKLWENLNRDGKAQKKRGLLSTKAAFIYDALYGYTDDYAKVLMEQVKDLAKEGYGWYGGIYLKSKQINKSLNLSTNAAVLEALNYKKIGNFYYAKEPKLYEYIRLHHFDEKGKYYIESKELELRYDAQKLMEELEDEKEIAWVERKTEDFVVRVGNFDTEEEALDFLDRLSVNIPRAKVVKGDINSKNFMLATRYYRYHYHIPYKNELISREKNKPFELYMKRYLKQKKMADKKKG